MSRYGTFNHEQVMLGQYFDYLQVLHSDALMTHLSGHAQTFEDLGRIGAGAYCTGGAQTVVLAVGGLTHTAEAVAFDYALESFTFGGADYVDESAFGEQVHRQGATQFGQCLKAFELGQVALRSYSGFLEVSGFGACGVLLFFLLEAYLHGLIAVFLNRLDLSNYAGPYFDHSARYVLTVGTEHGCHSDFLS